MTRGTRPSAGRASAPWRSPDGPVPAADLSTRRLGDSPRSCSGRCRRRSQRGGRLLRHWGRRRRGRNFLRRLGYGYRWRRVTRRTRRRLGGGSRSNRRFRRRSHGRSRRCRRRRWIHRRYGGRRRHIPKPIPRVAGGGHHRDDGRRAQQRGVAMHRAARRFVRRARSRAIAPAHARRIAGADSASLSAVGRRHDEAVERIERLDLDVELLDQRHRQRAKIREGCRR